MKQILTIFAVLLLVLAGTVFLIYRGGSKTTPNTKNNNTSPLPAGTVEIRGHRFKIEVAKTNEQLQKGLSNRSSLSQDHGMLFVFDHPDNYGFWMKNMQFPLDILFIHDTKIVTIDHNVQPPQGSNNLPVYYPTEPADKALEINAGLSEKYGFQDGDTVQIAL